MSEPIAAIATPPVPSAIGIVRVSGEGAIEAASAVFRAASGRPLAACESRRLVYGTLLGPDGAPIDQVLATLSRAPHSYTGEDTAELQCHGSPGSAARWRWRPCSPQGVRQAGPGEFTKRAFLNGRLDLTQAEAVADLIDAETPAAVRQAAGQLSGALSRRVAAVYDALAGSHWPTSTPCWTTRTRTSTPSGPSTIRARAWTPPVRAWQRLLRHL